MRNLIFRTNNPITRQDEQDVWSLQSQINKMFNDFLYHPFSSSNMEFVISPRVDFMETEKEYEITAELPGMDEKDIEITYHDGILNLKGEKKDEHEEKEKGYYYKERSYGSFQRSFSIAESLKEEDIKAEFKKGVLTIRAPKALKENSKTKKIEIKSV